MMFGRNKGSSRIVPYIPEGSTGVEIGVWKGDSSARFLKRAGHLHLVDPWSVEAYKGSDEFGGFQKFLKRYRRLAGRNEREFQAFYDRVYQDVCNRFDGKPVTIHRKTSVDFFADFDGLVDWFYIDGSHSYHGCLYDLTSAVKMARVAVFGDDYGNKSGVTAAVDQMRGKHFVKELGDHQYAIFV